MSLQIYGNSDNWFSSLIYTSISGVVACGIYYLYEGLLDYIEKINKIQKIQKNVAISQAKIIGLNNLNSKIQKKISEIEIQLEKISNNQITQNKSFAELTKKSLINEKMIPDYALIGYKRTDIPFFLPNDFDFKPESIKKYFKDTYRCGIIIDYLKYFRNIREINLFDLLIVENNQPEIYISTFKLSKEKDVIITLSADILLSTSNNNNNHISNPNYIPNITDRNAIQYYKNGLRKLRSLLAEFDIKLILNEDFENFIR